MVDLKSTAVPPQSLEPARFIVRDDSLEPDFPESTELIVDPWLPPNPGDLVIARDQETDATIAGRLERTPAGDLVRPPNPEHALLAIGLSAYIVGTVVEAIVRRRLR